MELVTIESIERLNHNVRQFRTTKPSDYTFKPGQAALIAGGDDRGAEEPHPFTFTGLPDEESLEFTIKIYPEHNGVTARFDELKAGDHLLVGEPFGAITYQGPGVFLAGGAGVTPFISILRDCLRRGELAKQTLVFSNQRREDTFMESELEQLCGGQLLMTLTRETVPGFLHGRIDSDMLENLELQGADNFYVCGPLPMVDSLVSVLSDLAVPAQRIVTEQSRH